MDQSADLSSIAITHQLSLIERVWGVGATILSVVYTVILVFVAAALAPFKDGHLVTPVMRVWCWLIFHTCSITAEVEGLEHIQGLDTFILVSNHKSLIDILAVLHFVPRETRFLAKREIMKVPLFGYAMARSGNIVIDRQSGGRSVRHAIATMRAGYCLCVFAEGHRFNDNLIHEFNEGAAWLALATKSPCVPIAIVGSGALMPRGSKFVIPGRRFRIEMGAPISVEGLRSADRAGLTSRLESSVRELYECARDRSGY